MTRLRTVLGAVAGLMLVASAFAHSLLGWPPQRAALQQIGASSDLVTGLAIGWYFAGAAILAFGVITLWTFAARARGRAASTVPVLVIGVVYAAYGACAWAATHVAFFLGVFALPGVLLLVAAWPDRRDA